MMWFFAVLIVLAMGGVGLVAAGRGRPMAGAYDDRPDALVPQDGPLMSGDLRRVRFSLALRGYRMAEVDALLERLATQLEAHDHDRLFGPASDRRLPAIAEGGAKAGAEPAAGPAADAERKTGADGPTADDVWRPPTP